MEVKNTGIDIIEIDRILAALRLHGVRFVGRILTPREVEEIGLTWPLPADMEYSQVNAARIAARFAAKEAVVKAIGSGVSGFSWKDIEILRRDREPPRVELAGGASAAARERGIGRITVTMSHSRSHAIAQAIAQGE